MPLAGGLTAVSKGRTVFVVATDGAAAHGIGEALGTAPGVDVITAGDGTPKPSPRSPPRCRTPPWS